MVGSGFSKNAQSKGSERISLPLWEDIAKRLAGALYPGEEAPTIDNPPRLAQEYDTWFGRSDLHRFLSDLIRDDDFIPGEAHSRLLQLPWRDVFTTNWDTLLEKARKNTPEQRYSEVMSTQQLPLMSQPRIIKLHGSLPSQFPLISTEEDYRTYPMRYAPFVNTVQQAMMETVFILIGFSGDDQNFLQWSGWVRDNLGNAAPKIYLAGWLDLSAPRRRMLEDRGVVPIDLKDHPQAGMWPKPLRPTYATEWILHTLEEAKPPDPVNWPNPPPMRRPIPPHLRPVMGIESNVPLEEPRVEQGQYASIG